MGRDHHNQWSEGHYGKKDENIALRLCKGQHGHDRVGGHDTRRRIYPYMVLGDGYLLLLLIVQRRNNVRTKQVCSKVADQNGEHK